MTTPTSFTPPALGTILCGSAGAVVGGMVTTFSSILGHDSVMKGSSVHEMGPLFTQALGEAARQEA